MHQLYKNSLDAQYKPMKKNIFCEYGMNLWNLENLWCSHKIVGQNWMQLSNNSFNYTPFTYFRHVLPTKQCDIWTHLFWRNLFHSHNRKFKPLQIWLKNSYHFSTWCHWATFASPRKIKGKESLMDYSQSSCYKWVFITIVHDKSWRRKKWK